MVTGLCVDELACDDADGGVEALATGLLPVDVQPTAAMPNRHTAATPRIQGG